MLSYPKGGLIRGWPLLVPTPALQVGFMWPLTEEEAKFLAKATESSLKQTPHLDPGVQEANGMPWPRKRDTDSRNL